MWTTFSLRSPLVRSARSYRSILTQRRATSDSYIFVRTFLTKRSPISSCNNVYKGKTVIFRNARYLATGATNVEKFILPDIGEGISEVVIKDWHVKLGDSIREFDGICDVESDKATATISSRFEGVITKVYYEVGDMAKVGQPLVDIEVQSLNSEDVEQPIGKTEVAKLPDDCPSTIHTLPSVRRFARERAIDLTKVKATGKHGRILKEDLLAHLEESSPKSSSRPIEPQPQQVAAELSTTATTTTTTTTLPFGSIQRAMFKTMTQSLKIPHFALKNDIDMTTLIEAAKKRNIGKKSEEKVSNLAFIIKMVSVALRDFAQLNASIGDNQDELVIKHYHNIGVAVDTPSGLIVPNIKNVQNLSIVEVNSELLRLRQLAYTNKLGPSDLSGGTITLSNIGAIGGLVGVPVIVAPEILIGALGEIRKVPRYNENDQLEARHILELTWSADHRVVDGATLSRFTLRLKELLERPDLALMKLR